ncbi:MAG TPA: cytochrome P450 [Ktedonobacteraceae bacterium]|jgi:cytochrome P450
MPENTSIFDHVSTLPQVQELYRWFAHMRAEQPVWFDKNSGCWHVFRYKDVLRVTTDYSSFSSERRQMRAFRSEDAGRSLIAMDPPDHRAYRNLVSPSFTPRALARLSGRIQEIAQELLDLVRERGSMDLVSDFAYPLPTIVIAEMLGVPTTDRPLFRQWAESLLSRQLSDEDFFKQDVESESNAEMKRIQQAFKEMSQYFQQMLKERHQHPREDMMTELQEAEIDGERLDGRDAVSFCTLLLLAGHVTTTNLLQQAILNFDRHPGVRAYLQARPQAMPEATEEVLRYASPVWRLTRITNEEVEIGGSTIPAGTPIFAWVSSANRDEEQFPNPEQFDPARTPNRHIAFGHGIHFCIGAPLSRMEAAVALPMLLTQLPDLHVENPQDLELQASRILFGFKQMPVTFTAC